MLLGVSLFFWVFLIKMKAVCSSKKPQNKPTLIIVEVAHWQWRHKEFWRVYIRLRAWRQGLRCLCPKMGCSWISDWKWHQVWSRTKIHQFFYQKEQWERMKPGFCVYLSQLWSLTIFYSLIWKQAHVMPSDAWMSKTNSESWKRVDVNLWSLVLCASVGWIWHARNRGTKLLEFICLALISHL